MTIKAVIFDVYSMMNQAINVLSNAIIKLQQKHIKYNDHFSSYCYSKAALNGLLFGMGFKELSVSAVSQFSD